MNNFLIFERKEKRFDREYFPIFPEKGKTIPFAKDYGE